MAVSMDSLATTLEKEAILGVLFDAGRAIVVSCRRNV